MTTQTDIQRYLDDWLGNAPMEPADRVVVAVAVRIARQPQRPAWRFGWQLDRPRTLAVAATAAALLVLAGLAVLLSGSRTVPEPSPSPSVSPRATGSGLAAQVIDPGVHTSDNPDMRFTYTLGTGWWSIASTETVLSLARDELASSGRFDVYFDAYPAHTDAAGCLQPIDFSVVPDLAVIRAGLGSNPGLIADVRSVGIDVLAGVTGTVLVRDSFEASCGEDGIGPGSIPTTRSPLAVVRGPDGEPIVVSEEAGRFVDIRFVDNGLGTMLLFVARGDEAFRALAGELTATITFREGPLTPTFAPVAPGVYETTRFGVPLRYELPEGWRPTLDTADSFVLGREEAGGSASIELVRGVFSVPKDASGCVAGNPADRSYWDRPHAPRDLVDGLGANEGYAVTAERVVVGGLRGFAIDLAIDDAAPICAATESTFMYVIHWSDGGFIFIGGGAGSTSSFTALNDGSGGTLVIEIRGDSPELLAEAADDRRRLCVQALTHGWGASILSSRPCAPRMVATARVGDEQEEVVRLLMGRPRRHAGAGPRARGSRAAPARSRWLRTAP